MAMNMLVLGNEYASLEIKIHLEGHKNAVSNFPTIISFIFYRIFQELISTYK
jgi:hypothetical protein